MQLQIQTNSGSETNVATLLFVISSTLPTDAKSYVAPRPDGDKRPLPNAISIQKRLEKLLASHRSRIFYHVNKLIDVYRLYILLSVAPNILAIIHGKDHLSFSCCYKIITHSGFICSLIKFLCSFIWHYAQCLALQIRQHSSYGLLQPIESMPVFFFILALDYVLMLLLSEERFNAIILVTCKFLKRVTFIKSADTWLAEQWAYAFLQRLDLIN